jgi:branched-chain amino acid transport system permease protein
MSFSRKALYAAITIALLVSINYVFVNGIGDFEVDAYAVIVILTIGINIILTVSLNLINGLTGQFSIGHAGFMAIGGYMAAYVTQTFGASIAASLGSRLEDTLGMSIVLAISLLAGAVAAALAGVVVGIPSLRLKGDYLAIVTLGFGEIIRVLLLNIDAVGGARGYTGIPVGLLPPANFFWIFGMVVLTIVIVRNIARSTFGRALAAIREDEIAAEAMGVNTTRYKVLSFVISSALAGVAGGLFAHLYTMTPESFGFVKSVEIIVMLVLGGIGSITGAVFGATAVSILQERLRPLDQVYPGLRMVIYSLLLILLMIFRPQGLLGRREFGRSWFRLPSKTKVPVALADATDAVKHTDARPVDRRSTLGGGDANE